ncbi:MAG: fatty acid desaturase, partial [bacterium]|nr:fatty acid desaturase [bacterium]
MMSYNARVKPNVFPLFFFLVLLHITALVGIFYYPPTLTLVLLALLYAHFVQGLGVTLGYHRLLAHRSFEFKYKWLERFFVTLACCGIQGGPIWWSSIHRLHHQFSDTPQDPHDSRKGFWYSHFMWLLYLDPRWKMPSNPHNYGERVKDIYSDPYYRFLDHWFLFPWVISLFIFYLVGGWAWVLWGGFVSFLYHHHVTWAVNSVSHRFGYRTFKTKPNTDLSTNNWLVGLL